MVFGGDRGGGGVYVDGEYDGRETFLVGIESRPWVGVDDRWGL